MKVNLYRTLLNESGHSYLVKEKTFNYLNDDDLHACEKIVDLMNDIFMMNQLDTEYVYMICMDTNCHITAIFELTHGTVNTSLLSTRELIIKALLSNAVNIIIIHNHPSGNVIPSQTDLAITKKIQEAFCLVDLALIDHIIISNSNHYSFADNNLLTNVSLKSQCTINTTE